MANNQGVKDRTIPSTDGTELQLDSASTNRECAHVTVTTYTNRARDLFRLRHWVRCLQCDLRLGPFPDLGFARFVAVAEDAEGRRGAQRHDRWVRS